MDKDQSIKSLLLEVRRLSSEENHLSALVRDLEHQNHTLQKENTLLRHENTLLVQEVTDLRSRLQGNSHNSHRPPSSDGYRKDTVKPAFDRKKGGKQGGQKGHSGHTLSQSSSPDKVEKCYPKPCSCGHCFTETELLHCESRQVFDIPDPKLHITEYRIFQGICPGCGTSAKGEAPEKVNAPVQYGKNIKALSPYSNGEFNVLVLSPLRKVIFSKNTPFTSLVDRVKMAEWGFRSGLSL